jgi:predicted nucleic acid-binding protein
VIVLDASAAVALVLAHPAGAAIQAKLKQPSMSLHAPHLIDVEVAQVLRRYWISGDLPTVIAHERLQAYLALPIARYAHDALLKRVWQMRGNVSAYDAVYLALAEALDAPLVTLDAKLAAAPGHHALVEVVNDAR